MIHFTIIFRRRPGEGSYVVISAGTVLAREHVAATAETRRSEGYAWIERIRCGVHPRICRKFLNGIFSDGCL